MFGAKWLIFLMVGFGILQGFFMLTEGGFTPGYTHEDIGAVYETHAATITQEGYKATIADPSAKDKSNIVNTIWKTANWGRYAVLDSGLGLYVKQFLLWPLTFALLFGLMLTLLAHIPIIGRGG